MFNKIKKMLHEKKGFSLIELLVVISIIGILATVIGVNYSIAKKTARDAKRKTDMENVAAAFEMYYSEFKKYPVCSDPGGPTGYVAATTTLNNTGYLTTIPKDPKEDGNNWTYNCASGDKWFGVYTKLEDTNEENITLPDLTSYPQENNIKQGSGVYHGDGSGNSLFYRVVGK